ncbi:two-component system sensor histidine kinase NtrB [Terriglobus saanensis]|uniref:histidine kinase n=1 Tax=Terriglobus saanensis (strain ATCC BAA-1853 / DSM 23119 / SP1PR4) TaxID=401053 RepID=E8V8F4_TERSS|nr:ATP-binding protein [Terriglobus saanensis]ADV82933.1 integral membrane sensor signal transduction histidine kinase [Terriglobus saanensis SP1PR4]
MPLLSVGLQSAFRSERVSPLLSRRLKIATVVLLVITLAFFTWVTPPHAEVLHNILHHLNILPFMLAGLFFGWRGALKTILLALALQAPSIHRHWHRAPLDAQDQIVELSTFGAAGIIAGALADRERMQRKKVEATKRELENVYTELHQNIERLKKTERLTAAGQLSASLAHEIRNPLASISGAAGILTRGQASPESQAECLDILTKESQRLNKLLTNFLTFARPRLPRFQATLPSEMIYSVAALAQHVAGEKGVALEVETSSDAREIDCDPEQIKQLLLNLLLNAIQATPNEGTVLIRTHFIVKALQVEVCDEGSGIAPEERDRIFEPFFTTKENGTGLGLAIAANIASQHGGTLTCRANIGGGAIFRMELPCSEAKPLPKQNLVQA